MAAAAPADMAGLAAPLIILAGAGIVIPAFARLKITPVIGFILLGMLVGPHGPLPLLGDAPWVRNLTIGDPAAVAPIAELGIVLLLFGVGLELSGPRLWALRRQIIGLGASQLFGAGLIIACGLWLAGVAPGAALGLGIALSLSSTALVLPMAGTTGAVGRPAFAMLLFEDIALVPIVFALGVASGAGGLGGLFETVVKGGAVVGALLLLGPIVLPRLFAQAARTKTPEQFMSVSLLVVILSAIATTLAGLSPIVGALAAGIVIAETDYAQAVEDVIAPFKGLALGVFLISVGMAIDLQYIAARWPLLLAAVVGVVGIKAIVVTILLRLSSVAKGSAVELGVMMASPGETTLIVLTAAVQGGLIGAQDAAFWQIVTAIGMTLTPLLARSGRSLARRIERGRLPLADAGVPDDATVLLGFGRVGEVVAALLDAHGRAWRAIDADAGLVHTARAAGRPVAFGDVTTQTVADRIGAAKAVVLTMDDAVQSLRLTRALRKARPELTIVVRARDADHAGALYRAGASDAVPETLESSLQLSEAVLVDLGVAVGPVIASIHEKRDEWRAAIMAAGDLSEKPRLRSLS